MLPLLGLIVSVYAVVRLLQVPLEMLAQEGVLAGFSHNFRWWIAVGLSWLGVIAIVILAAMLMLSGATIAR